MGKPLLAAQWAALAPSRGVSAEGKRGSDSSQRQPRLEKETPETTPRGNGRGWAWGHLETAWLWGRGGRLARLVFEGSHVQGAPSGSGLLAQRTKALGGLEGKPSPAQESGCVCRALGNPGPPGLDGGSHVWGAGALPVALGSESVGAPASSPTAPSRPLGPGPAGCAASRTPPERRPRTVRDSPGQGSSRQDPAGDRGGLWRRQRAEERGLGFSPDLRASSVLQRPGREGGDADEKG